MQPQTIAALLLLALVAACGGGSDTSCESCDYDEDCPEGWECQIFRWKDGPLEGRLAQYCAPEGSEDYECEILFPAYTAGVTGQAERYVPACLATDLPTTIVGADGSLYELRLVGEASVSGRSVEVYDYVPVEPGGAAPLSSRS